MALGNGNGRSFGGAQSNSAPSGDATVRESGVTLVHEGERISARAEDEAQIELADIDARSAITINLPVIVQVIGEHDGAETDRIAEETLRRLRVAVEAHGVVS